MESKIPRELDRLFDTLLGADKRLLYEQIGQKLPHHIRFNPLKGPLEAQQALFREQGFEFEPLPGQPGIFRILHQPYPIGKSLSHFLGHIYVQDTASMIPALILNPRPGDWVLDMAAAPGSKTTQMGTMMENRGVILANDVASKRLRALSQNLQRMTLCNGVLYKWYGEQFGNAYFEMFDRVLLDPGCSGLGTLHKNPEVLGWWNWNYCERLAVRQRNLITSAIKALRPGEILTYSTCTLTPIENEAIVDFALREFPVEVVPIELPGIRTWPGLTEFEGTTYHPSLARTLRMYPLDNITEGFYVACLRKTDSLKPPRMKKPITPTPMGFLSRKNSPVKKYLDYLTEHFRIPESVWQSYVYLMGTNSITFCSREMEAFPFYARPLQAGLPLVATMDRGAKLTTEGCHLIGQHAQQHVIDIEDLPTLQRFVNREEVDIPVEGKGQIIVRYRGCVIGYGLADGGRLKSQFPKAEWPFRLVDPEQAASKDNGGSNKFS